MRYPVSKPSLGKDEVFAVLDVFESGQITQGPKVAEFERAFAEYLGVQHVVACSSGTAGLHLALAALGLKHGDEVLIPDLTYIATANAVKYVGATPVLVDVDPTTWNLDIHDATEKLTERTKAILPVHLYGTPCNMHAVLKLAEHHDLLVIEDAAEALGGRWNGKACGTIGDCGVFSFYGNKILTTGEGGAVVTNDPDVAHTLRLLRGQGQGARRFHHDVLGFNYRMTDVAAAIGLAQLRQIYAFLDRRIDIVATYQQRFHGLLTYPTETGAAPWLFTALLPKDLSRDDVMEQMEVFGVETRPMFTPIHRQPVYRQWETFPVADAVAPRGISLPTYVELSVEGQLQICDLLERVVADVRRTRSTGAVS